MQGEDDREAEVQARVKCHVCVLEAGGRMVWNQLSGDSALNIFLVGHHVYMVLVRGVQLAVVQVHRLETDTWFLSKGL